MATITKDDAKRAEARKAADAKAQAEGFPNAARANEAKRLQAAAQPPEAAAEAKVKAKTGGARAEAIEAAKRGELPKAPDFSAETHKPYRKRLADMIAMVEAKDIAGLKALEIKAYSSSPKALAKYRDLAVMALEAQKAAG